MSMSTKSGSKEMIEALDIALKTHADESYQSNPSNFQYARTTRLRALDVRELLETQSGAVRGIAISWMKDIQPIAEILFGESLEGLELGEHKEYSPTVFNEIYARTKILSTDEMLGPTVSLDIAARDSI